MSWWNYGMQTLSALLAIGEGNPPVHCNLFLEWHSTFPDNMVHGANMGPIWGRQDPGGPMLAPWTLLSGLLCHHDGIKTWKCISGREGTRGFSLQRTTNAELWNSSCWTNSQLLVFWDALIRLQRYIWIFTLFMNMKSWYIFVIRHLYILMQIDIFFQGISMGWKAVSAL